MKIHIKLPGKGEIDIEREPMSDDRLFSVEMSLLMGGSLVFFLLLIWILR